MPLALNMPAPAMRIVMWQRRHQLLVDVLVAAVLLALTVLGHSRLETGPGTGPWTAAGWAVTGLCAVTLALRRRWPVVAWAGSSVLTTVWTFGVHAYMSPVDRVVLTMPHLFLVAGVPLCLAAIAGRMRMGATMAFYLASIVLAIFQDILHTEGGMDLDELALGVSLYALVYVLGVLVGLMIRVQSEQLAEFETRSERLALAREQATLLAAANERSRIAREMHDVVAHSLAVMITMAEGAAATIDRNPEMAKEALATLAESGRSALADTRRLVGVLRDDPAATSAPGQPVGPAGSEASPAAARTAAPPSAPGRGPQPVVRDLPVPEFAPPGTVAPRQPSVEIADLRRQATDARADTSTGDLPLAPTPEQAELEVLVERFQTAGVPVSYQRRGAPLPDDKALQLTVFRIAQEALTNVLRYAPTTRAVSVDLDRHRGTAVLTVDNDAAPGSTPMHGSGKGLVGMRERAAVYGGSVQAGPTTTGWRVRAVLHWDEDEEGTSPWQMPL